MNLLNSRIAPLIFVGSVAVATATLSLAGAGAAALLGQGGLQEEVSYTHDIQPLVSSYCTTCHQGKDPSGGLVLDTYEDVLRAMKGGELLARIHDEEDPMPPAGLMSTRQRALFPAWRDGGYLNEGDPSTAPSYEPFEPPEIVAVDVEKVGFELLEKLQGHWVGSMNLMGQEFAWFAWDYRAIAPSHVHGIFEGGTLGNLFTSFFVADFKGTRTVMARNGGLLNGIYRTSYFVLDRVEEAGGATSYRLVDAYGGERVMWMNLKFTGEGLEFTSHTSRLGMSAPPKLHMRFIGKRMHPELSKMAAQAVGFPKLVAEHRFKNGLPLPDWGKGVPVTSYSYIGESDTMTVVELAKICGDPIRVDQMPHLAEMQVTLERGPELRETPLQVYLSREALTDKAGKFLKRYGFLRDDVFDGILMFSELTAREEAMAFTYLHPGTYHLTVVADVNRDGLPSAGDVSHPSLIVTVPPRSKLDVRVPPLRVKN